MAVSMMCQEPAEETLSTLIIARSRADHGTCPSLAVATHAAIASYPSLRNRSVA